MRPDSGGSAVVIHRATGSRGYTNKARLRGLLITLFPLLPHTPQGAPAHAIRVYLRASAVPKLTPTFLTNPLTNPLSHPKDSA
jgi:hypothetical protein